MQTPKSWPAVLPERFSRRGDDERFDRTGKHRAPDADDVIVLRRGKGVADLLDRAARWSRHRLPFGLLGVPTQTIDMSAPGSASCPRGGCPTRTTFAMSSGNPGSRIGLSPPLMQSTFASSTSTPTHRDRPPPDKLQKPNPHSPDRRY